MSAAQSGPPTAIIHDHPTPSDLEWMRAHNRCERCEVLQDRLKATIIENVQQRRELREMAELIARLERMVEAPVRLAPASKMDRTPASKMDRTQVMHRPTPGALARAWAWLCE